MPYSIFITGASSGFGALTTRALADAGHNVFAGFLDLVLEAKAKKDVEKYSESSPGSITPVECDVTKDESCKSAFDVVLKSCDKLDILIHNAGHMTFGALEAFTPEQLANAYNINAIGPHRLNRVVLPHFRSQGRGLLIWVGSSSTRGGTPPYLGPYFAAKAGMDSLAVTYAAEVARFGIETSIVVPGAFPAGTNHFSSAGHPYDTAVAEVYETGPYKGIGEHIDKAMAAAAPKDDPPDVNEVAKAIVKVVDTPFGQRPWRVFIDPLNDGAEEVSNVADPVRERYYEKSGLEDLLKPAERKPEWDETIETRD